MEKVEGRNQTLITEFILLGFGEGPELRPFLFFVFLIIYFVTLTGNLLIMALVVADHHLHTPMYFFLWNLAFLETSYTCTILPRLLVSLLTAMLPLSCSSTQVLQLVAFIDAAIVTLIPCVMTLASYVCIIATILRIPSSTGRKKAFSTCSSHLMVVTLYYGIVFAVYVVPIVNTPNESQKVFSVFCTVLTPMINPIIYCLRNKEVNEALRKAIRKLLALTFCDSKEICSSTQILQLVAITDAAIMTLVPCAMSLASYVCIIATILRIPSTTGKQKAFSTCSSHLMVVTLYYGIVFAVYVVPIVSTPEVSQKAFSVFCRVLTPMINPIIYCLRNKEVNESLRKAIRKLVAVRHRNRIGKHKF
ncbi:olfactory receptor 2A7-like [Pelodiscus sinensis]|uniref:olfactory receptor 2A7-like n=1 Tax=Pelodiscus sinensis TaxID=13735 RepID=UPI003F6D7CC4